MNRSFAVALFVLFSASLAMADITEAGPVPDAFAAPRVVDLDGNGLDDLVYDSHVLLAQGGGSFVKRELALGKDETVVDWLDLNGDGLADLMTQHYAHLAPGLAHGIIPARAVRIQGPALTFSDRIDVIPLQITPMESPTEPYIGDFDGDGKDDLLLQRILFRDGRDDRAEMTIALSKGDGTFESRKAPFLIPSHPQWGHGRHVARADMNRDGRSDFVIRTTNDLVVLLNRGNAEFNVTSHYIPRKRLGAWDMDLGDVDRDGSVDVVMPGVRAVNVLFGDGRGGFHRSTGVFLPQKRAPLAPKGWESQAQTMALAYDAPRTLAVGEFIAKGRTEIVGATAEGDVFVVALENNRLKEVADRIVMPHIMPDLFVGAFRQSGSADFLMTDNFIYGHPAQPNATLFFGDAKPGQAQAVAPPTTRTTRARAIGARASAPLRMSVEARDCVADPAIKVLEIDGLWASHRTSTESLETFMDEEGRLHVRYRTSWEPFGLLGSLIREPNGGWVGTITNVSTPCGIQDITFHVER